MLEGKADMATVAETPIMLAAMKGKPLAIIAGIFSSDRNMGIVARRDKGIATPRDLAGKRIGTVPGTNGDYFRYAFLATHNVPTNAADSVALRPKEMADALETGRVDAVSVWNPWLLLSEKKLGNAGITFYGESIYTYTFNVTASKQLVTKDRDAVDAFLRGLKKAERFALENPAQSLEIVANDTGLDRELLKELWGRFTLRLSLEQTLLISMENQARWAIGEQNIGRKEIPDFLEFIYFDGLKLVSPEAVTIIH
jgi:NitT/TauT family transport system substrate-binding protein